MIKLRTLSLLIVVLLVVLNLGWYLYMLRCQCVTEVVHNNHFNLTSARQHENVAEALRESGISEKLRTNGDETLHEILREKVEEKRRQNSFENGEVPITQMLNATSDSYSDYIAFSQVNFAHGRWDQQRLYKMFDFALVGARYAEVSAAQAVCLATQSSFERIHSLVQVAHQWHGPISIGVFVAGAEEFQLLQYYVTYLRACFAHIRDNVVFHLATPAGRIEPLQRLKPLQIKESFNCRQPEETLRRLMKTRSAALIRWRLKNIYPQNQLRNLARKGCQSDMVFLVDVDIIPSRNASALLHEFVRSHVCSNLCAYVIPTYELDVRANYPRNKRELLQLVRKGLARSFHEKVFIYNQFATNFTRWQSPQTLANDELQHALYISHNVTNFEFLYEPFYVASDLVPMHDERFLGYGFTRNSQVYEMYVAGYEFFVLSPVFTCHWGLQRKKKRPAWREQQNNVNRKRFESFKMEIFAKYKKNMVGMLLQDSVAPSATISTAKLLSKE